MTSACWMLRACTRRNWGHGRSVLFEQRNGFKHASKKPEKIETELQNSQETTSQSSFTPIAEQVHPARIHILKQLYKPFLFTVGFSGSCFGIAAIWQYESLKNRMKTYFEDIRADWLEKIRPPKQGNFRKEVNEWWNSLSEGQKTVSGIIAANILVFCLWRVPSMQRTMIRYFTSNPASKSICLPMTLSTFSHYSFFHLAANMYVLWTFSSSIVSILGQEQFVAVCLFFSNKLAEEIILCWHSKIWIISFIFIFCSPLLFYILLTLSSPGRVCDFQTSMLQNHPDPIGLKGEYLFSD